MLLRREREIRQAALILAGQCIALLLFNLAEDVRAHRHARCQSRGFGQGHGYRCVQLTTLANVVVRLRLPYVMDSSGGFYPWLRWLAMRERVSPLLWTSWLLWRLARTQSIDHLCRG